MLACPINFLDFDQRRPSSALLPALLFSVVVHAVAGNMLFREWQHTSVEAPQPPLTVTLDAPTVPVVPVIERVPTHLERHDRKPKPPPVEALPTHHALALDVLKVEPIELPNTITPAPKTEPAPTIVANTPPLTVTAPGRADTIEPPHFNAAYLHNPEPPYPRLAKKLGIEGRVVLRVQVSAKGTPGQIAVAQTSGASLLDDAALKAVQRWTFIPARQGDTPIAHAIDVPIRFRLTK